MNVMWNYIMLLFHQLRPKLIEFSSVPLLGARTENQRYGFFYGILVTPYYSRTSMETAELWLSWLNISNVVLCSWPHILYLCVDFSARISQALLFPATCHPRLIVPQPWPCRPLVPQSGCSWGFCPSSSWWREQCKAADCCGQRTTLLLPLWKSDLSAAAVHV